MTMNAVAAIGGHSHVWHLTEVEYLDAQTVQRLECPCGATNFVSIS